MTSSEQRTARKRRLRVDLLEGGRIAFFSLGSNRLRTVLTTIGIGIGVCTLLAIVGIIQGLNQSFSQQLSLIGANTLSVSKYPWVMQGNWWEYRNRKELTLQNVDMLRENFMYASGVAPVVQKLGDVAFNGAQLSMVLIVGSGADYASIYGREVVSGRFLTDADDQNQSSVVVVGADVVSALYPHSDPVGSSIQIAGRPLRIVGTLARKGKFLGQSQDLTVIIPYKTWRAAFGKRRSLSIAISVADGSQITRAEDQLIAMLRKARQTPPEKADDFTINRPEQLANTYKKLTGALYGVAVGVGLITLLVGGIGIMNIMLVSVRERTREIGIRRALGARKNTIVFQFLLEASAVSALGGTLGTVAGLTIAKVVSLITPLAAAVQPVTVLFGIGFAAMVGLIFGIWPAARAASLDPVEALRHE